MSKTTLTLLISVLLIASQACTPSVPPLDPNFINTAIAQTHSAALTQTAQFGIPVTGPESPTVTKVSSPTPFPSFTPVTLGVPELRVSADTDCRTGPGDLYGRVRVLRAGEIADVVGRSADGSFWIIRNPDRPDELCWIAGARATLTGVAGLVPVFTPPPTPTPTRTRVFLFTSTPTRTPLPTSTPTRIFTSTPTRTFTPTLAPALTSTPTSTLFFTSTPSSTPASSTVTTSPTMTPTLSPTPTSTLSSSTATTSPTITPTLSATSTSSPTATPTPSFTPTLTPSPTFTPTPTSTLPAGFTASFSVLESCTGTGWWVDLAFANTGGLAFESLLVILSDNSIGTVLSLTSEDFTNRDGCSTTDIQTNLPPGTTRIVSLPVFTYDPTGHSLRATIVLCSNAGRGGTCISQAINFTP